MVIQAAEAHGIYIPRFCYHKHLTIAANCRMCLVEVEKAPKPLPACATPVTPGMKVFTKSAKTIAAQRAVMEFLLINHPLDCPVCDQGGECELQDLSMGYGKSHSRYDENKRSVPNDNIGPLIATEMTRCIQCTRCVRFGDEIAGMRELGAVNRGEDMMITTYVKHAIHSEISGNMIDLCPVGALTSKPFRFTARAWELHQSNSVSPHDCLGGNVHVHTMHGQVMRVVSKENADINLTWISDRDRYSYTGLYTPARIKAPLVRREGKLEVVSWQHALQVTAKGLQTCLEKDKDAMGILASPSSTLEELYLLQKIAKALGVKNIDYALRARQKIKAQPLPFSLQELAQAKNILIIGSHLNKEQPLLATRVRKAALNGAKIKALNAVSYPYTFEITSEKVVAPQYWVKALTEFLANDELTQDTFILLGSQALNHPEAKTLYNLAQSSGGKVGVLTQGANYLGGVVTEALFKQATHSTYEMLREPKKAYLLFNVNPTLDLVNSHLAAKAIEQADFTIAIASFENELVNQNAQVILPLAAFTETFGTFINALGHWQSFHGVANAFEQARPGWKILRALANFLELPDFEYESSEEVKAEIKTQMHDDIWPKDQEAPVETSLSAKLTRIGEIPLYAIDDLVRQAKPLQATQKIMDGEYESIKMHPNTAAKLNLQPGNTVDVKQDQASARLKLVLDERIAEDAAWIAGGITASSTLGDLFGEVEIT